METKVNKYNAPATREVFLSELIGARSVDAPIPIWAFWFDFILLFV
jgi:hypothetical protein